MPLVRHRVVYANGDVLVSNNWLTIGKKASIPTRGNCKRTLQEVAISSFTYCEMHACVRCVYAYACTWEDDLSESFCTFGIENLGTLVVPIVRLTIWLNKLIYLNLLELRSFDRGENFWLLGLESELAFFPHFLLFTSMNMILLTHYS